MARTVPRMTLPERTPEEHEADRQRALRTLEDIRALHRQILARRDGQPITVDEVDALLEELRAERGIQAWQS